MAVLSDYVSGTITLTNGSVDFTGTGTGWLLAQIREGDTIFYLPGTAYQGVIAEITSNVAGKLQRAWEGPTLANVPYRIRILSDGSRSTSQSAMLREQLGNGNIQALAGLTGSDQNFPMFTGPGAMKLVPKGDLISGVAVDKRLNTLADRAAYDGQAEGFSVYVANVGDGRAATYFKQSGATGDWSDPAYITGPQGAASTVPGIIWRGTYAAGTTYAINDGVRFNNSSFRKLTNSAAGTAPSSANPPVDNANWAVIAAKGADGLGTGDVVGPTTSVDDYLALFDGATGKLLKSAATIPDARVPATLTADKAFRRGNVLGTVSQAGGVPTGAIVERGSNANGEYVRWADGTQICTFSFPTTSFSTTAAGAVFHSAATAPAWTYPAAFVAVHYADMNTDDYLLSHPIQIGLTGFRPQYWTVAAVSGYVAAIKLCAIGRWF